MGTRPLSSEEILSIENRLGEARKRQHLISRYVAELEQRLDVGTCWCLSSEDCKRINIEVAEIVQQDNERSRLLEVKMYGHELTGNERRLRSLGIYPERIDTL